MDIENKVNYIGRIDRNRDISVILPPLTIPKIGPILNPDPTDPSKPYIYPYIFPAKELPYGSINDFPSSTYSRYWC